MSKSDAIVLVEATEIMESLPSAMRHDDQIMDSVIESLQSGVSKLSARQDALEIAQLKTQEAMAKGFQLVNTEIQSIKHEAEKDRIHANYAQKAAQEARQFAEQAWAKTQEVAIGVAKAEAKADGARDLAKSANNFRFDPMVSFAFLAILIFVILAIFTRLEVKRDGEEKSDKRQQQSSLPTQKNDPVWRCDLNETNATAKNCVRK
jgi:hypothetical protein